MKHVIRMVTCVIFLLFLTSADIKAEDYSSVMPNMNTDTQAVTATQVPVITDDAQKGVSAASPAALALVKKSIKLGIGEEFTLSFNRDNVDASFSTSKDNIVSVSEKGVIRGLKKGKAVITAVVGKEKYTCNVNVKETGLMYTDYTMSKGESLTVRLLNPNGGKVKWKSGNKKVATVKKGVVKAVKKGKTTIKAIVDGKTYSLNIKVVKGALSVIYLTFDDGPSLTSTPKILDILEKNNVKATFFTINFDKAGEELVKREDKAGHTVAIHGYSHDYKAIYSSESAYLSNIKKQQDRIYKAIGKKAWITRFPGGSSNLVSRNYKRGIMTSLVKLVPKEGFSYFDWNVGSGDSGGAFTPEEVYRNVTKGLRKNRSNVVLMHDFSNNTKTINALDKIIKYGKSHGYVFRPITESTTPVHHGVQN